MLLLFTLLGLAAAKKFYTPLYVGEEPHWSKLRKNETNTFMFGALYWEYYQVTVDYATSHIIINTTWDTAQYLKDGHSAQGVMLTYAAKDTFPGPTHWDWRGATYYHETSTSYVVNCANLAPGSKLLVAVAGEKGAVYSVSASSVAGYYSQPLELNWDEEYQVCSKEDSCDITSNQYVSYRVETPETCQKYVDCCYAVTVKGDFGVVEGFRMYVNHDSVVPTRAKHDYLYMPISTRGNIMDPERRSIEAQHDFTADITKEERIVVDGDGVYLSNTETKGVHYITATLTANPAFFFTADGSHPVSIKFIEEEGNVCDWKEAEQAFEMYNDLDLDTITDEQLKELEEFRREQEKEAKEGKVEVQSVSLNEIASQKTFRTQKKSAFPFW